MYTFTREQLEAHDIQIRKDYRDLVAEQTQQSLKEHVKAMQVQADEHIKREWDARKEQFASEDFENNFIEFMGCLLSISCRVLVERFSWKPIPKDGRYDRRNRLMKFSDAVIEELDKICKDDLMDIRNYNEQTYDLYGVRFNVTQKEDEQ